MRLEEENIERILANTLTKSILPRRELSINERVARSRLLVDYYFCSTCFLEIL